MGDGKLSEISQLLAIAVDMDGLPRQGYTEEAVGDLEYRLWYEFAESDIGQELAARCGPGIADRVKRIYDERTVGRSYATVDAFDELQKIGADLLVDLPEPQEPRPIPQPARTLTPEEEHASLVQRVRDELADPNVSAASITARRRSDPKYEAAFREANTPQEDKQTAPVVDGKVVQFSHLFTQAMNTYGRESLRPRQGIVTLKLPTGERYAYPAAKFNEMVEAAAQANLI